MRKIISIGICCITVMLSGCNKVSVQSSWNDGKIKIDAISKDWGPRLVWNEKNKTGLGVANDADNLYLCLTTSERTLPRLIMMGGFIVKIDQKGANSHNFGIKFPLGMNGQGFQPMEPPDDMSQEIGQDMRGQERPQSGMRSPQGMHGMNRSGQDNQDNGFMERMNDLQTELMLLGPGKGQETIVPLENDLGLEVKIGRDRQQLVYEIKIPFDLLGEYMQIEQISTTKPLKVNFSTVKIEIPSGGPGDEGMGGGPGGGMGGPGGGGMGGGPGGGMGGPGSEDSSDQSFSYNISITLAVKQ